MTLGDLEKRIQEIKECLIENFDWTEEGLADIPVRVCLEDEEAGYCTTLEDVSVDAPPLEMFLTGHIAKNIGETEGKK